jgi:hypothetical protein
LRNVKNETSYFENGLKNRFRAIAFRADEHFPPKSILGLFLNNFETLRKQHNDNDNGFVSTRKQEITFLIETRRF